MLHPVSSDLIVVEEKASLASEAFFILRDKSSKFIEHCFFYYVCKKRDTLKFSFSSIKHPREYGHSNCRYY
jgi:hypothetical protein